MVGLTEKSSYLKLKEYHNKNASSLNLREMFKDEERFNKYRYINLVYFDSEQFKTI